MSHHNSDEYIAALRYSWLTNLYDSVMRWTMREDTFKRKLVDQVSQLHSMQSGDIAYTKMNNPRHLQKLMSMGVLPGVTIKLLHRSPSFVFETGYSQFAVDEDIAADIYVRLNGL